MESLPWGFESQNAAVVDAGARERERWSDCGGCALELEVGRSHSQPTALGIRRWDGVWLWVPGPRETHALFLKSGDCCHS